MDFSRFKTSDWLKVGGGALMLIAGFLDWISFDYKGPTGAGVSSGVNAFEFFFTGTVPWILLVAVGVVTFLLAQRMMRAGSTPWPLIMLGAAGLALLLVLIRVLFNPGINTDDSAYGGVSRGIGMWLGLIAAGAATLGAFQGFTESGGRLDDLKDMNKIKSQFDRGGRPSRDRGYDDRPRRDDRDRGYDSRDRGYDDRGGRGGPPPPPPPYDDRH